ncbi:MAG: phage integrase N-terminal SAM-like domain-containing protein [Candidatus Binatia bacterium]
MDSYVGAVERFVRYFGRSPAELDREDIRTFQVHLVCDRSMFARAKGPRTAWCRSHRYCSRGCANTIARADPSSGCSPASVLVFPSRVAPFTAF